MKSTLTFALSALLIFAYPLLVEGQVTIQSGDVLILGSTAYTKTDTSSPSVQLGSMASGQVWDFTGLLEHQSDTTAIIDPAGTIGASRYPQANRTIEEDGTFDYFESTSSYVRFIGGAEIDSSDTAYFELNLKMMEFPAQIGSSFKDQGSAFGFAFPIGFDPDSTGPHPFVDSLGVTQWLSMDAEVVADGTLKTPDGDYEAIRQDYTLTVTDSIAMFANGSWQAVSPLMITLLGRPAVEHNDEKGIRWWANGASFPVCEASYDTTNTAIWAIEWLSGIDNGFVSVNEENAHTDWTIYPNPASKTATIEVPVDWTGTLTIHDKLGREVYSETVNGPRIDVDISLFPSGLYTARIQQVNGQRAETKQLVVINQ